MNIRFPALTSLDLTKGVHLADLTELGQLKHLTSLRLCRLPLSADDLRSVATHCSQLHHLDLRGCDSIKFKQLGALKTLPFLKTLNCSGAKQSSSLSLSELNEDRDLCDVMERLETLILGDCTMLSWVDDKLSQFIGSHSQRLVNLDLSGCIDISDLGLAGLCSGSAQLKTLSLQSCVRVTNEGLALVASRFKHLERLSTRGCPQINERGFRTVASLTSLTDLDLCSTTISSLSILSSLSKLNKLNLSNCSQLSSLDGIQSMTSLSDLNLNNCSRLPIKSLSWLSSLSSLQVLNASKLKALPSLIKPSSDEADGMEGLSGLSSLAALRLSANKSLPRTLLQAIGQMTSLEILALDNCSVQEESHEPYPSDLWFLEKLVKLSALDLSGWRQAKPSSLQSLSHLTNITALRLQRLGNNFFQGPKTVSPRKAPPSTGDDDDDDFGISEDKSFRETQQVGTQSYDCSSSTSIKFDMTWLEGLGKLEVLDVEACTGITDDCFSPISSLKHLQHLNLSGCIQLRLLHLNTLPSSLTSLSMDDCPLLTIQSASRSSESTSDLETLSLRRCPQLDDAALEVIASSLKGLIKLSLFSSPKVSVKGVQSISNLKRLSSLSLTHCWHLTLETLELLEQEKLFPCLSHINLAHCWRMTQAAFEEFRETRPNVELIV